MIGLVTLGHAPRLDHEAVYKTIAPGVSCKLVGALDELSCDEARRLEDKSGLSPLVCLLNDETTVEIPLPILFPFIERKVESLAQAGARLAVVLCCGGFPSFKSSIQVLLPGTIVPALVKAACPKGTIGIIVPNQAQESAAVEHWSTFGLNVVSAVVSPYESKSFRETGEKFNTINTDIVAIDCMGFQAEQRQRLKRLCGCPVLLPKTLVARVALEMHESSL